MQNDPFNKNELQLLEQSLKQFSLESERLDWVYQNLEMRFDAIQKNLHESHIRMSAKLAELNFVSIYLKTILDNISQGMIFIDTQGVVTTYNAAAQKILGVNEKKLLFHSFDQVFSDDFFGFSLKEAIKTQVCPKTNYVNWCRSSDEKFELEIETTFVVVDTGVNSLESQSSFGPSAHGLLIIIRNLTEMRRLQIIVNRHDVLNELGEMAAHLAHEIRNPLGGIKGFATLLHEDLKDQPSLQTMASNILQGTDNLSHLVTAILSYTRTFQLNLERVELVKFFDELKFFVEADPSWNSQIHFTIYSKENEIFASVDSQLFRAAMLNLILNASQAMTGQGKLTVSVEEHLNEVSILISDTGSGISGENLNKIFSPFFTTKSAGTGLGLAEVHKIIQAHSGSIGVDSEIGKGTSFKVKIPLKVKE